MKGIFSSQLTNSRYLKANQLLSSARTMDTSKATADGKMVKIELQSTQRLIYAKVLGPLTPAKENEGLMLRLSAASLASLGIKDNNERIVLTWNK